MIVDSSIAEAMLRVSENTRNIPETWSWGRLENLCKGVYDCPHSTPKLTATGPYVVRTQDISSGFLAASAAHVSEETYRERTVRAIPRRGDLLYSREGTYFGIAAEVPEGAEVCLGQRMVLIRPDETAIEFRFLRHWLNSPIMATYIHGFRDGSVAERLNLPTIRSLPVLIPSIREQSAIAGVLSALDDKIAVNDQVASAAFDLADARYVEAVGNAVRSESLGGLIDLKYGKALRSGNRVKGEFPVYGSGGVTGTHNRPSVEGPGVIVGRKGTVGAVYWSEQSFFPIDTTFYVVPRGDVVPMEFAFYMLKHLGLGGMNSDSAVPGLNRSNALALQVRVPDQTMLQRFHQETRSLFALRESLSVESMSLAKMRDTLLPKLMSGEIRVRDAEKVVEDVT